MPANLSPEYKEAEAAFRAAREPEEKLKWLREMLRVIPKHKGTDHLQADLKTRIKNLNEEIGKARKHGHRGPSVVIRPDGAGQMALLGPPRSGKTSLHTRLTGAGADSQTRRQALGPVPGMLRHLDNQFQVLDLPSISADFMHTWMPNALVHADGALLVVDIADPEVLSDVAAIHQRLAEKKVTLSAEPPERPGEDLENAELNQGAKRLSTLLIAAKSDLLGNDARAEVAAFQELAGVPYEAVAVSAHTGEGLEEIGRRIFDLLGVVRVYTKIPGRPADMTRPFSVRRGATVRDVARLVHRGLADEVKAARIWGSNCFAGQHVGHDHQVADGDVIELHW